MTQKYFRATLHGHRRNWRGSCTLRVTYRCAQLYESTISYMAGVEGERPESPALPLNLAEGGIAMWLVARALRVTYRCAQLYESTISYMAVSTSLQLDTEQ